MANEVSETKLLYLNDTFLFETEAKIIKTGTDDKGNFLVLNETIFYPQSGGQPCDTGIISFSDTQTSLDINFVSIVNQIVQHYYAKTEDDFFSNGQIIDKKIHLKINEQRRINNAKSHTAGHLLANIVEGLASDLKAVKGYHFPEGSYVEFNGKQTKYSNDELISKLNELLKESIGKKLSITVSIRIDEAHTEKIKRTVMINGYEGVPCGGTHLNNLDQLSEVSIKKIKFSKGNTQISYNFK
jgi:Ser-tRNA(Ala) deacylase AlaX